MRSTLGDLRGAIESINKDVMDERAAGEAMNDDVLRKLKSSRGDLVNFFTPKLVDMALVKLINEVCSRRGVKPFRVRHDLFGEYRGLPRAVSISIGKKEGHIAAYSAAGRILVEGP